MCDLCFGVEESLVKRIVISLSLVLLASVRIAGATNAADQRLEKKVTLFSGYTRLHSAISAISGASGVKMYCGSSSRDWQVRDMPVVICANDVSLGTLINLIADSYYLTVSKTTVHDEIIYRLRRPKLYQDYLAKYRKATEDFQVENEQFLWNVFSTAGLLGAEDADLAYADIMKRNPSFGDIYASPIGNARLGFDEIQVYGKLLNALGQQGRDRLLGGEVLQLRADQGGEVGQLVRDYAQLKQKIIKSQRYIASKGQSGTSDFLTDSDIAQASISFQISDVDRLSVDSTISLGSYGAFGPAYGGDVVGFTLDTRPRFRDSAPLLMKRLKESGNAGIDSKEEYVLRKPSESDVQLADVLTEVSKATGYSITADDYVDHKDFCSAYTRIMGGRRTMLDIKNALDEFMWFFDDGGRAINLKSVDWCNNYTSLVPETKFNAWVSRANGTGLGLVDYLAARNLTTEQAQQWVAGVSALSGLQRHSSLSRTQQCLLDMLSALSAPEIEQSIRTGIPVGDLDQNLFIHYCNSLPENTRPGPDQSQMMLRLIDGEGSSQGKCTYTVEVYGANTQVRHGIGVEFPIYSAKREKELSAPTSK
jgi:hypothetical protein